MIYYFEFIEKTWGGRGAVVITLFFSSRHSFKKRESEDLKVSGPCFRSDDISLNRLDFNYGLHWT